MDAKRGGWRRLVVFGLAGQEYGVAAALVREVVQSARPRPVPGSPSCVEGVITLRGCVIPVVDLRARLGLAGPRPAGPAVVIVVALARLTVGVVVDDVREELRIDHERPPRGDEAAFVEAVATGGGRRVLVLDMAGLLEEGLAA